jgi:hypothetical protein
MMVLESSINSTICFFFCFPIQAINPQFKKEIDSIGVILTLHELVGITRALIVKQIYNSPCHIPKPTMNIIANTRTASLIWVP